MSVLSRRLHRAAFLGALITMSCATPPPADPSPSDPTFAPGDAAYVLFLGDNELSGVYTLDPDGRLSLPLMGELTAAGRTTTQLEDDIRQSLAPYYVAPPTVRITLVPNDVAAKAEAEKQAADANPDLAVQTKAARETLEARQATLESYRAQPEVAALLNEKADDPEADELASQITRARLDLGDAESRLAAIHRSASTNTRHDAPGISPEMRSRYADAVAHRDELQTLYKPDPRQVRAADMVIDEVERQLGEEFERVLANQTIEVENSRARLTALERSQAGEDEQSSEDDLALVRLRQLERDVEASREAYEALLKQGRTTETQ